MTSLADYGTSVIRTAVPGLVGGVAAWGTAHGIGIPADTREVATAALTFGFLSVYYAGVRALELKFPKLGVLLGVPKKPVYAGLAPSLAHRGAAGRHELGALADDIDPVDIGADPDPALRG